MSETIDPLSLVDKGIVNILGYFNWNNPKNFIRQENLVSIFSDEVLFCVSNDTESMTYGSAKNKVKN